MIHLCPVKTTTLWAWQGSCNQRKNISAKQNWSSGYFFSSSRQFCTFCMVMDNFIFCWHSKGTQMKWAYKVKFFIFKSRHQNTSSPYKSLQTSIATETLHTSLFTFLALKELENLKKFLPNVFFFFLKGGHKNSALWIISLRNWQYNYWRLKLEVKEVWWIMMIYPDDITIGCMLYLSVYMRGINMFWLGANVTCFAAKHSSLE